MSHPIRLLSATPTTFILSGRTGVFYDQILLRRLAEEWGTRRLTLDLWSPTVDVGMMLKDVDRTAWQPAIPES